MKLLGIVVIAAFLTFGCGKKDDGKAGGEAPAGQADKPADKPADTPADKPADKPADTAAVAATPDGTQPAGADGEPEEELPTAEDFEDEAMTEITAENLEKQLKELEEDLGE